MTIVPSRAYVIFRGDTRVTAAVADSDETRARGLMFRESLADDEGMLFTFERAGRYGFWMKNVGMALDIIWLDERCRIVWMVESAPPCVEEPCPMYTPRGRASYVVEVAGGFVRRHGIAVGDTVTITPLPAADASFRTPTPGRC
jgi:uncharacterized membrane protein (UPF0127 family)